MSPGSPETAGITIAGDGTPVETIGPHPNPMITYLGMGATFLELAAFVTTYTKEISENGYSTEPYTTIYYMALWDALISMYGIGQLIIAPLGIGAVIFSNTPAV